MLAAQGNARDASSGEAVGEGLMSDKLQLVASRR
jgi:hypothetical protein